MTFFRYPISFFLLSLGLSLGCQRSAKEKKPVEADEASQVTPTLPPTLDLYIGPLEDMNPDDTGHLTLKTQVCGTNTKVLINNPTATVGLYSQSASFTCPTPPATPDQKVTVSLPAPGNCVDVAFAPVPKYNGIWSYTAMANVDCGWDESDLSNNTSFLSGAYPPGNIYIGAFSVTANNNLNYSYQANICVSGPGYHRRNWGLFLDQTQRPQSLSGATNSGSTSLLPNQCKSISGNGLATPSFNSSQSYSAWLMVECNQGEYPCTDNAQSDTFRAP